VKISYRSQSNYICDGITRGLSFTYSLTNRINLYRGVNARYRQTLNETRKPICNPGSFNRRVPVFMQMNPHARRRYGLYVRIRAYEITAVISSEKEIYGASLEQSLINGYL